VDSKKKKYDPKTRYKDYHSTFSTPSGRRVLQNLYDKWMRPSPFDINPITMAKKVGKQEAFRDIMAILAFDDFKSLEEFVYATSIAGQPDDEPGSGEESQ
jgi:hypothetical protein